MTPRLSRLAVCALVATAALTGCTDSDDDPAAAPAASVSPTPVGTAPAPTTPTTAGTPAVTPSNGPGPRGVEITLPPAGVEAAGPAVVLVHGGGWVAGSPGDMDRWAQSLAATGAVVFNASYRLVYQGGGYPESVDDIECAVRYARAEAPRLTSSDELVIMGHSAGGHLAAVVALNGDEFGADCPYPVADPPDRLIGLAGVYDVRAIGPLFGGFVGASQTAQPQQWTAVNPVELTAERDDLSVLLVTAARDEIIPPASAADFAAALPPNTVETVVIAGAGHADLLSPDVVGVSTLHLGG